MLLQHITGVDEINGTTQQSASLNADKDKKKQTRLSIPTACPYCNGSLKDEMDSDALLKSLLAGRVHTALSTTIVLATKALPPKDRYKLPSIVIRALLWFAKKRTSKPYDEMIIARIEVPTELWGGLVQIAKEHDTYREDVFYREKVLRDAWVRFHMLYLDRFLKRAGKYEHRKALRTVVDFLPAF